MRTKTYASVSFGKDSLAMLLMMIERGEPPDEVVFYNSGVEFRALYDVRDRVLPYLKRLGIRYTELTPEHPFRYNMLERTVHKRNGTVQSGYGWCGGLTRWGTSEKVRALARHTRDGLDCVGIAYDEPQRLTKEYRPNKRFPLYEWGVTEAEALRYCYDRGIAWTEDGIELYGILDRVSCWCCGNKNLKELRNIRCLLPGYWEGLKELQSGTSWPFRRSGETIFDLERRFSFGK